MNQSYYSIKWKDENQPVVKEPELEDWESCEEKEHAKKKIISTESTELTESQSISEKNTCAESLLIPNETPLQRKQRERRLTEESDIALLKELLAEKTSRKKTAK